MADSNKQRAGVFFDLDGTLVDTAPDFHLAINRLRQEENLPELSLAEFRTVVSEGSVAMISAAFQHIDDPQGLESLRQRLLAFYLDNIATHSRLFDGMSETLSWLDNNHIPWGIVTNKPWLYTNPLLAALELSERSHCIICPDHVSQTKPDPEGLLAACQQSDTTPELSIYVGDHRRDIEAGQNAGMTTVGAAYGYLHPDETPESWQADFLTSTPTAILPWLIERLTGYKAPHV